MKSVFVTFLYSSLLLLLVGVVSCNRYIDKATIEREVPIEKGGFTFYPDSNVLIYKSNIGLRMDTELRKPKAFYSKLPKGLKWYEIENSESFTFYYANSQVVAFHIDLSNSKVDQDTMYVPSKAELDQFIANYFVASSGKYNLMNIPFKEERKILIMKKGAATILLYNIVLGRYDLFVEDLSKFKFI